MINYKKEVLKMKNIILDFEGDDGTWDLCFEKRITNDSDKSFSNGKSYMPMYTYIKYTEGSYIIDDETEIYIYEEMFQHTIIDALYDSTNKKIFFDGMKKNQIDEFVDWTNIYKNHLLSKIN